MPSGLTQTWRESTLAGATHRCDWTVAVAGDQQRGWSPAGNGVVGIRHVVFHFEIETDPGGHLLVYSSDDGMLYGDTWHESVAAALQPNRRRWKYSEFLRLLGNM